VTLSAAARAAVATHGAEVMTAAARAMLWRRGDLSWALHSGQHEARHLLNLAERRGERRSVWMCGRRWGKTRMAVVDAMEFALKRPGSRIPYGALTWQSATDFVFPEVEYLREWAPAGEKPEIVDGEVRLPNKSVIVVSGCEDERKANRLRGPAADRAYIDEAGFIDVLPYVVNSVVEWQLLTRDGTMILASSSPLTPAHPFVDFVNESERNGTLITRTTPDAPHITATALAKMCQKMGGATSTEWRREALCEIITDESRAVIPEWGPNADRIVVSEWPAAPYRHWYVAADLGYVDLTAVLLAWYDFAAGKLIVEDEAILVRPTSGDIQSATAEMERRHIPDGQEVASRVADAPLITIADLAKLQPNDTPEQLRWRVTQKDDLEGAINAVRLSVARGEIIINKRCTTLLRHISTAIWNKGRTAFDRSDAAGIGHFDALAALVYLNRSIRRGENPYPPAGRPDRTGRWVPIGSYDDGSTKIKSGGGVRIR
jgi:hypothetical protein